MNAKVHGLDGREIEVDAPMGVPDVIDALQALLEDAKAGRINAFMMVVNRPGSIQTLARGMWPGNFFQAVGALMALPIDMLSGSRLDEQP